AGGGGSRHGPQEAARCPQFELKSRKAVAPSAGEVAANPRARSAKLRLAVRTSAAHEPVDRRGLGMPELKRAV
ncbi:MAG: 16S rRNA (cytosine(1402)-N(4))-methyltransferase, partial [Pseudomonadota bacterium]